jgi:site-specific recombinase XerD
MKGITFFTAIEGFNLSMSARHLSPNTMADYNVTLQKFKAYLREDVLTSQITSQDIEKFLASFTEMSNKTLLNYHVGLSAMWTWMEREGFVKQNVVRKVKAPKAERKKVEPFTKKELQDILAALKRSKTYRRQGKPLDHELNSFERNRAIFLLMLDTGMRASELCDLKVEDMDNKNNRVFVRKGKGAKERLLPFSHRTGQMIWRYLATRENVTDKDPLFISKINRPMHRTKLSAMFRSVGARAGISNVHPHRLRHTFAIQYLRNGGDAYTLQSMLGHSTFETVKLYLKLAQSDLDETHRRVSPVDNWRL